MPPIYGKPDYSPLPRNTSYPHKHFIAHLKMKDRPLDEFPDFKSHLRVRIAGVPTEALLDGGNNYRSCLSKTFFYNIGGKPDDLSPLPDDEVATAQEGASLKILGMCRSKVVLQVEGSPTKYAFQPVVIDGLAMDVNLSGPWMAAHGWDQLHSKGKIRIQSKEYPLVHKNAEDFAVYVCEEIVVPPLQKVFVPLKTRDPAMNGHLKDEGYLRGELGFMVHTGLVPALNAIVAPGKDGSMIGAVLNPSHETVVISRSLRYGSYTPVERISINALTNQKAATTDLLLEPPSSKEQRQEYMKDLMRQAKKVKKTAHADLSGKCQSKPEQEAWLVEQFKLKDCPCLKNPKDLQRALDLLREFWDVFAHNEQYGHTHLLEHVIDTGSAAPIKSRYKPVNPSLEPDLEKQIIKWLEQDIIEESLSPWSSNLVAVRKKNGDIRWCIDWRRLNDVTKSDAYPMPHVADTIRKLAGSTIFSGLDLRGAFHVMDIRHGDREKTAFSTPSGHYHFKRLGFGLKNGPPSYCRLVAEVLRGISPDVVVGFMDDGVVHSPDLTGHLDNLRVTLTAYRRAGLKLGPDKCSFFQPEITYLGHVINASGIRPPASYIDSVRKWPIPRYKTDARAFMGVVNYYSSHIPRFSAIAAPWREVTGKVDKVAERTPLIVTPEMEASFEQLKIALTEAPILGFPYFRGPKAGRFTLDTDYCKQAIAGILSQNQCGREVVIAYGSSKCSTAQQNYPSTKGELWAGVFFMKKFRYYLGYTSRFTWRTDNSALQFNLDMEKQGPAICRWLSDLQEYDFDVEHRAGKDHTNADGLSRANITAEQLKPRIAAILLKERRRFIAALIDRDKWGVLVPLAQQKVLIHHSDGDLVARQNEDEDLAEARKWLQAGEAPHPLDVKRLSLVGKAYAQQFEQLYVNKVGHIRIKLPAHDFEEQKTAFCLPRLLWDDAIRIGHSSCGHQASEITYRQIQLAVYFPGMKKEIEGFISTCVTCQTKGTATPKGQQHTAVTPTMGFPFMRIHVDFVGPLSVTARGNRYILTIKDAFTKWTEAIPLKTLSTEEMVTALDREIFCRYGLPEAIHSDMGSQFTSCLYKELARELGIQITHTGGYHPQGNGQVERFHRDLKSILNAIQEDSHESWDLCLPQALFASRTSYNTAIKMTPYQALFGRDPSAPLSVIFGDPNRGYDLDQLGRRELAKYLRTMRKRIDAAHTYIRQSLKGVVKRQKRMYNAEKRMFMQGSKVWLFTPRSRPGQPRKFARYWTGPFIVCATPTSSEVMVRIVPCPSWAGEWAQKSIVVSMDRLKLCRTHDVNPPDPGDDLLMEGDEFAELINLGKQDRVGEESDSSDEGEIGPHTPRPAPDNYRGPRPRGGNRAPGPAAPGGGGGGGPPRPRPPQPPGPGAPPPPRGPPNPPGGPPPGNPPGGNNPPGGPPPGDGFQPPGGPPGDDGFQPPGGPPWDDGFQPPGGPPDDGFYPPGGPPGDPFFYPNQDDGQDDDDNDRPPHDFHGRRRPRNDSDSDSSGDGRPRRRRRRHRLQNIPDRHDSSTSTDSSLERRHDPDFEPSSSQESTSEASMRTVIEANVRRGNDDDPPAPPGAGAVGQDPAEDQHMAEVRQDPPRRQQPQRERRPPDRLQYHQMQQDQIMMPPPPPPPPSGVVRKRPTSHIPRSPLQPPPQAITAYRQESSDSEAATSARGQGAVPKRQRPEGQMENVHLPLRPGPLGQPADSGTDDSMREYQVNRPAAPSHAMQQTHIPLRPGVLRGEPYSDSEYSPQHEMARPAVPQPSEASPSVISTAIHSGVSPPRRGPGSVDGTQALPQQDGTPSVVSTAIHSGVSPPRQGPGAGISLAPTASPSASSAPSSTSNVSGQSTSTRRTDHRLQPAKKKPMDKGQMRLPRLHTTKQPYPPEPPHGGHGIKRPLSVAGSEPPAIKVRWERGEKRGPPSTVEPLAKRELDQRGQHRVRGQRPASPATYLDDPLHGHPLAVEGASAMPPRHPLPEGEEPGATLRLADVTARGPYLHPMDLAPGSPQGSYYPSESGMATPSSAVTDRRGSPISPQVSAHGTPQQPTPRQWVADRLESFRGSVPPTQELTGKPSHSEYYRYTSSEGSAGQRQEPTSSEARYLDHQLDELDKELRLKNLIDLNERDRRVQEKLKHFENERRRREHEQYEADIQFARQYGNRDLNPPPVNIREVEEPEDDMLADRPVSHSSQASLPASLPALPLAFGTGEDMPRGVIRRVETDQTVDRDRMRRSSPTARAELDQTHSDDDTESHRSHLSRFNRNEPGRKTYKKNNRGHKN